MNYALIEKRDRGKPHLAVRGQRAGVSQRGGRRAAAPWASATATKTACSRGMGSQY